MIILYLYLAVTVGIILGGFFSGAKVADEKMKAHAKGWDEGFEEGYDKGYDLGYGEGFNEPPDEDPQAEYTDEELRMMKDKH